MRVIVKRRDAIVEKGGHSREETPYVQIILYIAVSSDVIVAGLVTS